MVNIKILVAAHKEYPMPTDRLYLPVSVGTAIRTSAVPTGYTPDNTGENISELNPYFCELTALYWAWKNLDYDYIGLAHYRRHFSLSSSRNKLLKYSEISEYLGKIKVFLPKKRHYYIESLYSHYAHTFDASQLDTAGRIINEKFPEYSKSFSCALKKTYGYMFNMMIMTQELLDNYCGFLFTILFELRNRIDETQMDAFQKRYPGRVAEILFNVWLDYKLTNGELTKNEIMEIPVVSMEKVDWIKKGSSFLKAKFFGKKYDKSF